GWWMLPCLQMAVLLQVLASRCCPLGHPRPPSCPTRRSSDLFSAEYAAWRPESSVGRFRRDPATRGCLCDGIGSLSHRGELFRRPLSTRYPSESANGIQRRRLHPKFRAPL